jgi:hypothetical protein
VAHTTVELAQAWAEQTKLTLSQLDADLELQEADYVIGRLAATFDVSTWLDATSTPRQVKQIIAMLYVSSHLNRTYGVDADANDPYAALLRNRANSMIDGLLTGGLTLLDDPNPNADNPGEPVFYPNDNSSVLDPRDFPDDTSVGPAKFSMGMIF